MWLEIDGVRRELRAGDVAHVPAGVTHSGGTLGSERVERVVVFSPAGMEHFFVALAHSADPLALALEHGWRCG